MIPDDHPDKRPLDERVAELERGRHEAAARWDPRVLMDHPEAGGLPDWETDDVSGLYAERLRVFWGSLAVALTAWGRGRPPTDVKDDDVRYALEYAARALCYRRPSGRWLTAIDALQDAHTDRFRDVQDIPDLPLARPAMTELLAMPSSPPLTPEDLGKLPSEVLRELFSPRNLFAAAKQAVTPRDLGDRLRLFWASVWLTLATWATLPDGLPEKPLRDRARGAIERGAIAVCSRGPGRLRAAEVDARDVLAAAQTRRPQQ